MGGVHMNYCLVLFLAAWSAMYGSQATVVHISDRVSDKSPAHKPPAQGPAAESGRTILEGLSSASDSSASSPDSSGDSSPAHRRSMTGMGTPSPVRLRRSINTTRLSEVDQKLAQSMSARLGDTDLSAGLPRSSGFGPVRATAIPSLAAASAAATGSLPVHASVIPLLRLEGAVATRPSSAASVAAASEISTDSDDSPNLPTVPSTPLLTARNSGTRPSTAVSTARPTPIHAAENAALVQRNSEILNLTYQVRTQQETLAERDVMVQRLVKAREQQQNEIRQLMGANCELIRINHHYMEEIAALKRELERFSAMYRHHATVHIPVPNENAAAAPLVNAGAPQRPAFAALVALAELGAGSSEQPPQAVQAMSPLLAVLPEPNQSPEAVRLRVHVQSTQGLSNE
jgi:hypothetical protein